MVGAITDSCKNFETISLFNYIDAEKEFITIKQNDEIEIATKSSLYSERIKIWQMLAANILLLTNIFLLVRLFNYGLLSIADCSLIFMLTFGIVNNTWFLGHLLQETYIAIGNINVVIELLQLERNPCQKNTYDKGYFRYGAINFSNVRFGYDKNKYFLKCDKLLISKNDKVVISGSSGIGKSTFLQLI